MNFFSNYSFRLISYRFLTAFQIRRMLSNSKTITERYEVCHWKSNLSIPKTIRIFIKETISALNTLQSNQTAIKSTDQRGKRSMENIISNLSFLNVQVKRIN